jgi:hypothetical protein
MIGQASSRHGRGVGGVEELSDLLGGQRRDQTRTRAAWPSAGRARETAAARTPDTPDGGPNRAVEVRADVRAGISVPNGPPGAGCSVGAGPEGPSRNRSRSSTCGPPDRPQPTGRAPPPTRPCEPERSCRGDAGRRIQLGCVPRSIGRTRCRMTSSSRRPARSDFARGSSLRIDSRAQLSDSAMPCHKALVIDIDTTLACCDEV